MTYRSNEGCVLGIITIKQQKYTQMDTHHSATTPSTKHTMLTNFTYFKLDVNRSSTRD